MIWMLKDKKLQQIFWNLSGSIVSFSLIVLSFIIILVRFSFRDVARIDCFSERVNWFYVDSHFALCIFICIKWNVCLTSSSWCAGRLGAFLHLLFLLFSLSTLSWEREREVQYVCVNIHTVMGNRKYTLLVKKSRPKVL